MLSLGIVSKSIYFVLKGCLKVYRQNEEKPFMEIDDGGYYGDISFLFKQNNIYRYHSEYDKCFNKYA